VVWCGVVWCGVACDALQCDTTVDGGSVGCSSWRVEAVGVPC